MVTNRNATAEGSAVARNCAAGHGDSDGRTTTSINCHTAAAVIIYRINSVITYFNAREGKTCRSVNAAAGNFVTRYGVTYNSTTGKACCS